MSNRKRLIRANIPDPPVSDDGELVNPELLTLRTRTNVDQLVDDAASTLEGPLYALRAQVDQRNVDASVISQLSKVADAIVKVSREERARAALKDDELGGLSQDEIEKLAREALEADDE